MTEKRKWRKGPPPHIGWWNASMFRNQVTWRWWDGVRWSIGAWSHLPGGAALRAARVSALPGTCIQWTDYYPEKARVPRVDPRKVVK